MSGARPIPRVAVRIDPAGVRSVFVDGNEIPHVTAVSVEAGVDQATVVRISLVGVHVEFAGDAEVIATMEQP